MEEDIFITPIAESELLAGQYLESEITMLTEALTLTLTDVAAPLPMAAPINNSYGISTVSADPRKKPSGDDTYYTINGNCDITIHGYDKQNLYRMATYEWSLEASYTLPVYNVGYLTYGDITLCDIEELKEGKDYSAFINNVTINGFSSNYEYRLELHNGQVTLWSKLPGESPAVPEPRAIMYCLLASVLTVTERKRKV